MLNLRSTFHRTSSLTFSSSLLSCGKYCTSTTGQQRTDSSKPVVKEDESVVNNNSCENERLDTTRDIFRCAGIERHALTMRRRVQVGAALQVLGTTVSNYLYHSDVYTTMNSVHYENTALLLGLNILALWKFHALLRDALLARHVTKIAVAENGPLSIPGNSCDGEAAETTVQILLLETGPWTRRVELIQPRPTSVTGDDLDRTGYQVPIGKVLELGLLHVDRRQGQVIDEHAFESLLSCGMVVGNEEITTDRIHAKHAFVSQDSLLPFLTEAGISGQPEDGSRSIMEELQNNEWMNKNLQIHGGQAMSWFGNLALCMGFGTIIWWAIPRQRSSNVFSRCSEI